MNLAEVHKKERIRGALIGAILPVVLLLISSYILLQFHPLTVTEFGFAIAQNDYGDYLLENITEPEKYTAFFCLSANMAFVWYLTAKKKEVMANGVILPTVIYAVVLVALRLLS